MKKSLREIAELIGGEVVGNGSIEIEGVAGIEEAGKGEITFISDKKHLFLLETTQASAVIVSCEIKKARVPLIRVENPYFGFSQVTRILVPYQKPTEGIHPSAIISEGVDLGKGVSIGARSVIEEKAKIGDNTIIYPLVYLGKGSRIGRDCIIYPQVMIREGVEIGDRVIIHSGTVVGSDGFGYIPHEGKQYKVPQIGKVVIENDVEIGANVTIDRATLGKTWIKKGVKIDNLVQIAHNVVIGEDSIIVAQVGISGSTEIGKGVTLAGQAGLAGHIRIGDKAIVGAQAGVTKSVPPNTIVSGYPARPHTQAKRIEASILRLPELHKLVRELKKRLEELEKKR
ncbi:MAG TPA: UDP-3-O-(3-hydroxymyristoyl)glucosamine N-acyltransferase [bacterium]|nr:UDP-3-O-(3-hydroxymyristoyl)glucosamine N-acyltransferase [bacterium]